MAEINIGAISEALNDKTDRDMRNVDNTALTTTGVTGWIADSRNGRVYWEVKGIAA